MDRSNNNSEKNPGDAEHRATPKKHDTLDWATLVVLVFTFIAASLAAFQAKRLADLTYELVVDSRGIADRQARLVARSMKSVVIHWLVARALGFPQDA